MATTKNAKAVYAAEMRRASKLKTSASRAKAMEAAAEKLLKSKEAK